MSSKVDNTPESQSRRGENSVPLRIYLLTVWSEASQGAATWRFRLEDPQTCQRQGFVNAHDLITLLEKGLLAINAGLPTNQDETARGETRDE